MVLLGFTMLFEDVRDSTPTWWWWLPPPLDVVGRLVAFTRRYLVEGIAIAAHVYSLCFGENTRSGYRTMVALYGWFYLLGYRFWRSGLMVVASGGVVCINRVDDSESQRRSAARTQR
jgi:hypothetical protein